MYLGTVYSPKWITIFDCCFSWSIQGSVLGCQLLLSDFCVYIATCFFSNWTFKQESDRFRNLYFLRWVVVIKTGINLWQLLSSVCLRGGRPCHLIFAAGTTKIFRLWDGLFGQLVPLFHNCLKTVNQMDLVSVKETFGSLWQWEFVVIQAKPYEDKCSSLTH